MANTPFDQIAKNRSGGSGSGGGGGRGGGTPFDAIAGKRGGQGGGGGGGLPSGVVSVGPPKAKGGRSFGGFLHNVESGIVGGTLGALSGPELAAKSLYHDYSNPHFLRAMVEASTVPSLQNVRHLMHTSQTSKQVVVPLAHSYAVKYGPGIKAGELAATGHEGAAAAQLHQLGKNIYADPIGTLLDAATIATLGGAGVAKVGQLTAKAGLIADESRLARLGQPGEIQLRSAGYREGGEGGVFTKATSKNPVIRARQQAMHGLANLLPEDIGGLGLPTSEHARYIRAVDRQVRRSSRRVQALSHAFDSAKQRLNRFEQRAYESHANAMHPHEQIDYLKTVNPNWESDKVVSAKIKQLSNPKVIDAFENPSARLQKVITLGDNLTRDMWTERLNHLSGKDLGDYRSLQKQVDTVEQRLAQGGRKLTQPEKNLFNRWREIRDRIGVNPATATDQEIRDASRGHWQNQLGSQFAERPYLHLRLARGAQFVNRPGETAGLAARRAAVAQAERDFARVEQKVAKSQEDLVAQGAQPLGNKVLYDNRLLSPDHVNELERMGGALSRARDKLEIAEKKWLSQHGHLPQGLTQAEKNTMYDAIRHRLPEPGFKGEENVLQGGPTVEQLRAELEASGRAQPFYHPDIIAQKQPSLLARGAGRGVPGPDARLRLNLGQVFRSGALYAHPDALSVAHLGLAKRVVAHAIHTQLLQDGVKWPSSEGIPRGWSYIRSGVDEKIPYLTATEGETLHYLRGEGGKLDFTTANPDDALTVNTIDGEHRVIVPNAYVNRLAGEFTRSNSVIRALFTKPTNVWRAIVLGLRPGFFTNNAVGNYLLYGLRHHGWASVQAWMSMLRQAGATKALDELGRDQTFRRLAMQHIPETYTNTYARTAFEGVPGARVLRRLQHGIGPLTARVAEEVPRELIARETVIREAKRLGVKIPRQAQEFNRLSDEILARPEMASRAVEEANTTLGDYLHYSPFESQIRQLVPFYGWLRAITRIAAHTALNTPGRALLLMKLGQLALQENETQYGPLPDYLRSMLPLSGIHQGNVWALGQGGLNPFSTIGQLAQAAGAIIGGNPGEGAKAMADIGVNPFITGLYEWMSGKSAYSGVRLKPQKIAGVRLPGLLGYELGATAGALPPANVLRGLTGHAYKSRIYANQNDWWKALAQWTGAPVVNVNLPAANRTARLQGRP